MALCKTYLCFGNKIRTITKLKNLQENQKCITLDSLIGDQIELIKIIRHGRLDLLTEFCDHIEPDLELEEYLGYYLLCLALQHKHHCIVQWLLAKNCKVNRIFENDLSDTPLHIAVKNNDQDMIANLIERGAQLSEPDYNGDTPLHISCSNNKINITKLLLKDNQLINSKNSFSKTPLHIVVEEGNLEILNLFLAYQNTDVNSVTYDCNFTGCTPLHIAIKKNNLKIVNTLLDNKADFNAVVRCDKGVSENNCMHVKLCGYNALHLAIHFKCTEIVDELIRRGASIESFTSFTGMASIHVVIQNNDPQMLKKLFDLNVDYKVKTKNGENILHLAVMHSWTYVIEIFINNLDVNDMTNDGNTALHIATEMGDESIVELLLSYNADCSIKNNEGQTPLHFAAEFSPEIIQILLNNGADINATNNSNQTPLCIAITAANEDVVSVLLKNSPKINNANDKIAINNLLQKNNSEVSCRKIVNSLVLYGFHIFLDETRDVNILYMFLMQDDYEICAKLLEKQESINLNQPITKAEVSDILLHNAVIYEKFEFAKLFLKYKSNVNLTDCNKKTAFSYAIEGNNLNIINLLLLKGAEAKNLTKIFLNAARDSELLLVQLLIRHNININCEDEFGTTVMHFATWHGLPKFVNYLLDQGASPSKCTKIDCNTSEDHNDMYRHILKRQISTSPLHIAVNRKNIKVISNLLEHHFDVNSRDGYGRTPLHIAAAMKCKNQKSIIEILLQYGADINVLDDSNHLPIYYLSYPACMCSIAFQNQYDLYYECDCHNDNEVDAREIGKTIVEYLAILYFKNEFIHPENLNIINTYFKLDDFQSSCIMEISHLKHQTIYDNVSLFDILTKKSNALAVYGRNPEIFQFCELFNCKEFFPIYGDILERQFSLSRTRFYLLENAKNIFSGYLNYTLPEIVSDKIFDFLSLTDLRNIDKSFENPSSYNCPPKKKRKLE